MIDFFSFNNEELYSIWQSMDKIEWNRLLGKKPNRFDELPEDFSSWNGFGWNKVCKRTYTEPIKALVGHLLGREKLREFQNRGKFRTREEWELYRALEDTYPIGFEIENLNLVFEHFRDKE